MTALSTLKAFWEAYPEYMDVREATLAWYQHTLKADWATPANLKREFASASILKDGRVVSKWSTSDSLEPMSNTTGSMPRRFEGGIKMEIKLIRTENDYRAALKEIEKLMIAQPGTSEGDRLDVLVTLVETYEKSITSLISLIPWRLSNT